MAVLTFVEPAVVTEAEFAAMEAKFLETLMARDYLVYQGSELLKAEYMEKIGMLEYIKRKKLAIYSGIEQNICWN